MARAGRPPFPPLQDYRQHPYLLPHTNQQTGTSSRPKTTPSRTPAPHRQTKAPPNRTPAPRHQIKAPNNLTPAPHRRTQAPFDRNRPPPKNLANRAPAPYRQAQAPFNRNRLHPKTLDVESPDNARKEGAVDWENEAKAKGKQVKMLEARLLKQEMEIASLKQIIEDAVFNVKGYKLADLMYWKVQCERLEERISANEPIYRSIPPSEEAIFPGPQPIHPLPGSVPQSVRLTAHPLPALLRDIWPQTNHPPQPPVPLATQLVHPPPQQVPPPPQPGPLPLQPVPPPWPLPPLPLVVTTETPLLGFPFVMSPTVMTPVPSPLTPPADGMQLPPMASPILSTPTVSPLTPPANGMQLPPPGAQKDLPGPMGPRRLRQRKAKGQKPERKIIKRKCKTKKNYKV